MTLPSVNESTVDASLQRYLAAYNEPLKQQVKALLISEKSAQWLRNKYPEAHTMSSERQLYDYAMTLKNRFMRTSAPLSKVIYDDKIHIINNALGLHSFVSRVQGNKLKAKHEIRISALFRRMPQALLKMILVHELAHLKEKQHNKAFYRLCCHMTEDYHQLEFDVRCYLAHKELFGELW